MGITWFEFHMSWAASFGTLSNEEIGNLTKVIINYIDKDVKNFSPEFVGNEKLIWPIIKADIDIDLASRGSD